jgi:hypothetical protein
MDIVVRVSKEKGIALKILREIKTYGISAIISFYILRQIIEN